MKGLCDWCGMKPKAGKAFCKCGFALVPLHELSERDRTVLKATRPSQYAAAAKRDRR